MSSHSQQPTVVVLGASSGIGRGIAVYLSSTKKYKLALLARNMARLTETEKLCVSENAAVQTLKLQCDVANADSVKSCMDTINDRFSPLAVIVNSAGTFLYQTIGDSAPNADTNAELVAKINEQIDVDVKGLIFSCVYGLPYIQQTKKLYPQISCAIIALSGRSATMRGLPKGFSIYLAALCAKRGFMDGLFKDLRDQGIKTCLLMPGNVNTPMSSSYFKVPEQAVQPNDIGYIVESILAAPHTCVPSEMVIEPQYDTGEENAVFNSINSKL